MYSTIANIDLYEIPSCNRFDLSAQYTSADGGWSAMLYANNVADEICVNEFNAGNGFGGQAFLGSVTNHREIGLTLALEPVLLTSIVFDLPSGRPMLPPQRSGEELNVQTLAYSPLCCVYRK